MITAPEPVMPLNTTEPPLHNESVAYCNVHLNDPEPPWSAAPCESALHPVKFTEEKARAVSATKTAPDPVTVVVHVSIVVDHKRSKLSEADPGKYAKEPSGAEQETAQQRETFVAGANSR
jgi:hypothetical protein